MDEQTTAPTQPAPLKDTRSGPVFFSTVVGGVLGFLLGWAGDNSERKLGRLFLSIGGAVGGFFMAMYAERRQEVPVTIAEPGAAVVPPPAVPGEAKAPVQLETLQHQGRVQAAEPAMGAAR